MSRAAAAPGESRKGIFSSGNRALALGILLCFLCLALAAFTLRRLDALKPADWYEGQFTYLPSGKFLKPMALDMDEALASIIWVKGMLYFADSYLTGRSYHWMGHIVDIVTVLNPRFMPAYEFGGLVLAEGDTTVHHALALLEKGIGEFPDHWKYRVYAAMTRLHIDSNFVAAAEYVQPLQHRTDVPEYVRGLALTFASKGLSSPGALVFLLEGYFGSADPMSRKMVVDKIWKNFAERPAGVLAPARVEKEKAVVEEHLRRIGEDPENAAAHYGELVRFLRGG